MIHHKVKEINALDNYYLSVDFEDGKKKIYDMKKLIYKIDDFKPLLYINGLFKQVKVDVGGYGIFWNDRIDLSCNELYNNGVDIIEKIED